jgi:hypothetical protein
MNQRMAGSIVEDLKRMRPVPGLATVVGFTHAGQTCPCVPVPSLHNCYRCWQFLNDQMREFLNVGPEPDF